MDEEIDLEDKKASRGDLNTCANLQGGICGELQRFGDGKASVLFKPDERMAVDSSRIIHCGFLFNAASFAAMCAVNTKFAVVISCQTHFLSPIEIGHEIAFEASGANSESKRNEVKVEGFLLDIKVFEAHFHIIVMDQQIFRVSKKSLGE